MLPTENEGASRARPILCTLLVALFAMPAYSQTLGTTDAVGVDSFKNALLDLDFDAGTVTPRNTDNFTLQKINSVELGPNRCSSRVDAFVADRDGGKVLRYPNAAGDGDLVCDPASSDCPIAPNGLSRNSVKVLAVGDVGIRNRDAARVWIVPPENCPADTFSPPALLDAEICVTDPRNGRCLDPDAVVDVEFINRPVGGFDTDALLVLTQQPTALMHYPAPLVACTAAGESCDEAGDPETLLVFTSRSDRRPSGLAMLPGGEVLVSFDDGFIKTVLLRNDAASEASTLFATGLDPNLAGIDGGYLRGEEVVIAARRPGGEFFKLAVSRDAANNNEPTGTIVAVTDEVEIQSRDAAINSLQLALDECLEIANEENGPIRICEFPEIDLIFNGLANVPEGYTAEILQSRIICDSSDITVPRELPLAGLGFTGYLNDLVVPENIIGLEVSPDCRALVILEIGDTFMAGELPPTSWVEYDFNTNFLGDLGTCRENNGRIGYHPVPGTAPPWLNGTLALPGGEGDQFGDTTVACFNPPRGMGRENSAVVIGASRLKTLWEEQPGFPTESDLAYIKGYALEQIGYLITLLNNPTVLDNDEFFKSKLQGAAERVRDAINSAGTTATYDAAFATGRDIAASAAVVVSENRFRFDEAPQLGDVLSRFANMALYLEEDGRGVDWEAPCYGLAEQPSCAN